jgi:hypothetical protein
MSQKSSVPQAASFVSQLLKRNKALPLLRRRISPPLLSPVYASDTSGANRVAYTRRGLVL